ncbi:MAG: polysaccharide biosynthesis tyrosine autokinase [Gemmatimonadaceae bacterium]|nr:polysaccharide biosynthesis tyrosine autokinase [Gemmatimonadaceae bacterium]
MSPPVRHDPAKCEVCADYQQEYFLFARGALPELARAYLEADEEATEARERARKQLQFLREIHAESDVLQRELDARALKIEKLQRSIDVREAQPEREALQRELDARTSMFETLQHELKARTARLEMLQRELEAGALRLEELHHRVAARETESETLKRDLDASVWRAAELEKELRQDSLARDGEADELRRELNARMERIDELQMELLHISSAHDVERDALQRELESRASIPEALQGELETRASRIAEMERDAGAHAAEEEALKRELEALNGRIQGLQEELLQLSAARDTENQALERELDVRAARIEDLQREVGAGATEQEALKRELNALTATVQAQLQGAAVRNAEIEALQEQLRASTMRSARLEDDLRRSFAARDAEGQELSGSAVAHKAERDALQRELDARTSMFETLQHELKARTARLEMLQRELEAGALRLEELHHRVAARETESETLKRDLDASVWRATELEKELRQDSLARDGEADELRRELNARMERIDELQMELLHVSSAHDVERDALQRELESRASIPEVLQGELETRASRIAEMERDAGAHAAEEEALKRELEALTATTQAQLQRAASRDAKIEALQEQLHASTMRSARLEDDLELSFAARGAEGQELKRELDARAARIEELQAELLQSFATRETEEGALQQHPEVATSAASSLREDAAFRDKGQAQGDDGFLGEASAHDAEPDTVQRDTNGMKPITDVLKPELNGQSVGPEADRGEPEPGASRTSEMQQDERAKEESRSALVVAATRSQPRNSDMRGPGGMPDPGLTFAQATQDQDDHLSFRQLTRTVRRNRWLVLGITLATIASATVYNRLADPIYQSSATIRIDDKDAGTALLTGVAAMPGLSGSKIQTEMEVLRSRQLAENVARKLHLNLQVLEPSGARRFVRIVDMPSDVARLEVVLTRQGASSYVIVPEGNGAHIGVPQEVQVGVPFSIGRATLVLDRPPTGALPPRIELQFRPLRRSVDAMRKALTVARPQREAQIINVRYESNDPVVAAAVPNLLLDEFIRYKAQTNKTEATSTVGFLRQQVASYEGQLRAAETALGGFREQARVVSIGDEAQAQVRQMADMQAERDQLQSERQALAAIMAKVPLQGENAARDIAAFPSFITNRAMQDILQSLIQLENERSQLLIRRNPENADVVAVSKRIGDLERQLSQMARAYLAGVDSKLASLNSGVQSFGKRIETIPAKEIAFARLSRDQKLLEDISTLLQTRLKEAEIKEAIQPGDVRGIDRALVPDRPTSPKPARNILFGIFGGLFLGIVAAVAREMLDTKVRTKEDVQSVTGGMPILGAIPRIPDNGNARPSRKRARRGPTEVVAAMGLPGNRLITQMSSRDVFAESYRALRTNITFTAADHPNQVLVITSALVGDGKSTSASNLAVTLAQQGVRTLLVDADLRKGVLHSTFALPREPGLTQLLIGECSIEAALQKVSLGDEGQSLHVLTSGRLPPNPAELLGSERMRKLLEELRQQFDMIVFDTPPLTLVTDAAVLGTLSDSTVLVARAGVTDKRALHHAAEQLYHLRVQVSGTIVNDFNPKEAGYGYEYGYGYSPGYGRGYAYGPSR